MIDVFDYRAGNSPSVIYALERLGLECRLVAKPEEIAESERLVLPGGGPGGGPPDLRREAALPDAPTQSVQQDRVPFLGICIGLQVLFEHSEEGDTPGLGWLPGRIRRFGDGLRVPQIGWNEVRFPRSHPVAAGLPDRGHYYFVNSYYADPANSADTLGRTEYGIEFSSVVARDNVAPTNFPAGKRGARALRSPP